MLRKLLSLLSDSLIFGAASALSQLIQFCLLPLLTFFLTPVDYGVLDMLNVFMLLYVPLANIGMSNAIFRRFNTCKDEATRRDVLSTGLVSVVGSTLLFGAICFAFSAPLTDLIIHDRSLIHLTWLTIGSAMLHSLQNIGVVTLRADRRAKTVAVLGIINVLVSVSTTVTLVVAFNQGVAGAVIGTFVGSVTNCTLTFAACWNRFAFQMHRDVWRDMLGYGLPFVPHHVQAVLLGAFGQIVVNQWLGREATGLYGMAMKFSLPFAFLVNSVQKAWVPFKFQIHAEEADAPAFFRGIVTYYVAATTYLWLGVCLWGPPLLVLMTAADFHAASALIPVTALIPLSHGLYFMFGTGIEMGNSTRSMPLITGLGLTVVILCSLLLVEPLGAAGAAWASAIGWFAMTVAIYFVSQQHYKIAYDWPAIGAMTAAVMALVGLELAAQQYLAPAGLLALAVVLSLIYPVIVAGILLRSPTERHRVKALFGRLKRFRKQRGKKRSSEGPGNQPPADNPVVPTSEPAAVD